MIFSTVLCCSRVKFIFPVFKTAIFPVNKNCLEINVFLKIMLCLDCKDYFLWTNDQFYNDVVEFHIGILKPTLRKYH